MLDKIKLRIAKYIYSSILRNNESKDSYAFVFDKVKTVGLIFDNNNIEVNLLAKSIIEEGKKNSNIISVSELGYGLEESNKPNKIGIPTIFFDKEDLNSYGRPKSEDVNTFINTPFDLLINISDNNLWPIKFCVASSKAKFKVGKFEEGNDVYDFMIDAEDDYDTSKFNDLLLNYLKIFNKK